MKNNRLLLLILFFTISSFTYAQDDNGSKDDKQFTTIEPEQDARKDNYNHWTIELDAGMSKGAKPYAAGNKYYASDPDKFFGGWQFNHFGGSVRYMINSKFGFKTHLSYDMLKNLNGSESYTFRTRSLQMTLEGVVNAVRLFDVQDELKRFGFIFHSGIQVTQITPQERQEPLPSLGHTEWNGGVTVGVTPQYRITNNIGVFVDFTANSNVRQHFNWDGSYAARDNNLVGSMYTTSLGVTFSFGNEKIHGDWAVIEDPRLKEVDALNERIGEIETLMNDTDKDGVPDYLDVENNSIAGVAVDTKGRMVDKNENGVPDQLEKYIDNSITNNNNAAGNNSNKSGDNMLLQLINDGYIAAYFDMANPQPTNASSDNIGFILNYLRTHPSKSVDIIGYADVLGVTDSNNKLSESRAQNIKTILIKAGISPSRLNIKGNGIDNSVSKDSEHARRLVRKVVFLIK